MVGAIDIGGTKIAVGIVDRQGKVLARRKCPTAPERGFPDALAQMIQLLREAATEAQVTIEGIGIGSTGPIDPFKGTIEEAPLLPGWRGAPIAVELERAFGVSAVLENDADAATLAEGAWGSGREAECFIYVTISTGIGTGLLHHGQLFRGARGAHPELGHFVVDYSGGPQCYCGLQGCWEVLAAGPALEAWYAAQTPAGSATVSSAEICRRAAAGEPLARRAMEREAHYLGLGFVNLVTSFCPDVIAVGGGVMQSAALFLDQARAMARRLATQVPASQTKIALATLGADVGLCGAAGAWLHRQHQLNA